VFTREQIKGVLETFRDDREAAIANLRFKQAEMEKKNKVNKKIQLKQQVED